MMSLRPVNSGRSSNLRTAEADTKANVCLTLAKIRSIKFGMTYRLFCAADFSGPNCSEQIPTKTIAQTFNTELSTEVRVLHG